ncbi:hypothetical protein ACFP47_11415 [Nesterenkonia lacusekhoensis]|uniref:Uncharacterized protein n=1 Tax=Nesterenkonia lacusekhoensis TaxID=150832 RepID=A0ABS4T4X4_9MICC|nr:hypothetical protein [Nesterenkonia lacusekhoensis]MBP2319512.1 hypothetical protein [Nesterenkonia lacusekhoensis]
MSKYVDLKGACKHTGRSTATINRRAASGELPVFRDWSDGGKNKYRIEDLDHVFGLERVIPANEREAREYADLKAAARKIVAKAPKMTDAKREELASILQPAVTALSGGEARV